MYDNIAEFRNFIAWANNKQIEKAISYINITGFVEGNRNINYDNEMLTKHAIEYAKSDYCSVSSFLVSEVGINLYNL